MVQFCRQKTGLFCVENVKAPSTDGKWEGGWRGSIVAGKRESGIGWQTLFKNNSTDDLTAKDLRIQLQPTTKITGTYRSPEGNNLSGDLVVVASVYHPTSNLTTSDRPSELELAQSQLMPMAEASSKGEFSFEGLPTNKLAFVHSAPAA